MRLSGHGIAVDVPAGWEGKVFLLPGTGPTMHAANFPLPPSDGNFGAGAISSMAEDGVFVALVEYERTLAGAGLFASQGLPAPLTARDMNARAMQRMMPGRFGVQRFFTERGRAFCLYAVIGSRPSRDVLVGNVNDIVGGLYIDARSTARG